MLDYLPKADEVLGLVGIKMRLSALDSKMGTIRKQRTPCEHASNCLHESGDPGGVVPFDPSSWDLASSAIGCPSIPIELRTLQDLAASDGAAAT